MAAIDITPEIFIENMLVHVPFEGWSKNAMQNSADELGLSAPDVAKLFPKGIESVISIGSAVVDKKMVAEFTARFADVSDEMPVHIKIRELLLIRFEILQHNKEAVRKLVAFMAQPAYAKIGVGLVYNTLDTVWREAGDKSTDINFYTKRATLAAVYGSTMLAFLDDNTPNMAKTKAFLDRRLKDVANVPKVTKPFRSAASLLGDMLGNIVNMRGQKSD